MKPLIRLNKELNTGLHPGLVYDDVPLWEDGANIVFRRDYVSPLIGQFALFQKPSSQPVRGMFECMLAGVPTVFYGTYTKLYTWTKAAGLTDVTRVAGPYTGVHESIWCFLQWGAHVLATNGKDAPQVYIPSVGKFADFSTENTSGYSWTTAELLFPYKSFCIAMNTTNTDDTPHTGGVDFVHFSESDDYTKWDPTIASNNECGDLPIRDAEGPIMAGILYRKVLFFFTCHGGHVLNYVGAPNFFGSQKILRVGVVGKQGLDVYLDTMYGFAAHGLWASDGSQVKFIDEPSIHDYVFGDDRLNHDARHMVVVWGNQFDGVVEFHFPTGTSMENDAAVGYNPENGTWTIIQRVRSSAAHVNTLSYGLTGTSHGDILAQLVGEYWSAVRQAPSIGAPFIWTESYTQIYGYGFPGYGEGGYGGA